MSMFTSLQDILISEEKRRIQAQIAKHKRIIQKSLSEKHNKSISMQYVDDHVEIYLLFRNLDMEETFDEIQCPLIRE